MHQAGGSFGYGSDLSRRLSHDAPAESWRPSEDHDQLERRTADNRKVCVVTERLSPPIFAVDALPQISGPRNTSQTERREADSQIKPKFCRA
jgi:hypothetical protein